MILIYGSIPSAAIPDRALPSHALPGLEFTAVYHVEEEIKRNDLMKVAMMALQAGLLD